jgi:hypothetical protein
MEQRAKGQVPAVDMRMAGGRDSSAVFLASTTGGKPSQRRRPICGALRQEFEWTIELDVEFGPTTSLLRLLDLIDNLDKTVRDKTLRASIEAVWKVPAKDASLKSTARMRELRSESAAPGD